MLWDLLMALHYWIVSKTTSAPPPYVDPDWDVYLRNKYGIKQPMAKED